MSYAKLIEKVAQTYLAMETTQKHTRCSGCGNYGILNALMSAIALEGYKPHEVILANDVWCSGNLSDKIEINTMHGLHGRSLPLASWIHLARPDVPVFAMAWDGATMSEGVNHLIHTARNNYNITFLLHNNHNYGLTTGQASATTPKGYRMNAVVGETNAHPLLPAQLVLASGWTFVARWYSGNVEQLINLIRAWMHHRGFSFIEVMQLCPTYSKATPEKWYEQRVYDIAQRDDYDIHDKWHAAKVVENFEHIATGLLYQNTEEIDFLGLQTYRTSTITPVEESISTSVDGLLEKMRV